MPSYLSVAHIPPANTFLNRCFYGDRAGKTTLQSNSADSKFRRLVPIVRLDCIAYTYIRKAGCTIPWIHSQCRAIRVVQVRYIFQLQNLERFIFLSLFQPSVESKGVLFARPVGAVTNRRLNATRLASSFT